MLSVQIFSSPGQNVLLADFTYLVRPPFGGGIRFSSNRHGFASCELPFVPMSLEEAFLVYDWPGTPHLVISDEAADEIWNGRLEDVAIVGGGVRLVSFGYWRALSDVVYTALWSRSGVAGFTALTVDDGPEFENPKFSFDSLNRLFIGLVKDTKYFSSPQNDRGAVFYEIPNKGERQIVEVSFDYEHDLPNQMDFRLVAFNSGLVSQVIEWSDGGGSPSSGSQTIVLSAPKDAVLFEVVQVQGQTNYVDETGEQYGKITNLRVKTQTGTVLASDIVSSLALFVNGINPLQLSSSASSIEVTTTDLEDELYEDEMPAAILDDLALRHGFECGVWESQRLYWRPQASQGKHWYVDVTRLELERSLNEVQNSFYGVYSGVSGQRLRTDVADDMVSQAQWSLVRRGLLQVRTSSESEAETFRDVALENAVGLQVRAAIDFAHVYDDGGADYPLYVLRAGDTLTMRNLPPTLSVEIDNIRTFLIGFAEFNSVDGTIRLEPMTPVPTLVTLTAGLS